jgi:hypothetical protein
MDRLLRDTGNTLIPGTLVEAGAAPSVPTRKLNLNGWCKEILFVVCLFSWHYNPLWSYFSQPGSGL